MPLFLPEDTSILVMGLNTLGSHRTRPVTSEDLGYTFSVLLKAQAIWHCFHPGALPLFYLKTTAYWSCSWKPWSAGATLLNQKTWVYFFCFLLKA
jgi:hypothetical protein